MRANNNGFNYGPDIIANDPYTTDSYVAGDEYSHRDDEVSSERYVFCSIFRIMLSQNLQASNEWQWPASGTPLLCDGM